MSNTTLPPPYWPPNLDRDLLVPILLANGISFILLGSLISRIFSYLLRYTKDSAYIRGVVWALLFANVFHGAAQLARDIAVFGLGFGDWHVWGDFRSRPQDFMVPTLSVLVISTSQATIATRSYLFARSLALGRLSIMDLVWTIFNRTLIVASLVFGLGTIILAAKYSDLFALGEENHLALVGVNSYPLFEMMWLLTGTVADISIAWAMLNDARKAKTGTKNSSNSVIRTLMNVALRCGAVLALVQTLLNILYFTDTPTWADAAHSLLPRVSSLTVIYSITSPREAYRAYLRKQEREAQLASVSFERRRGTPPNSPGGRVGSSKERGSPPGGITARVGSRGGVKPSLLVRLAGSKTGTSNSGRLDRRETSLEEGYSGRGSGGAGTEEEWVDEEGGIVMEEKGIEGKGGRAEAATTTRSAELLPLPTISFAGPSIERNEAVESSREREKGS